LSLAGYVLPFLFILSLVVFLHELRHFLIGWWCVVKGETFFFGFGGIADCAASEAASKQRLRPGRSNAGAV
jgi:hypothetical protein